MNSLLLAEASHANLPPNPSCQLRTADCGLSPNGLRTNGCGLGD
jgi:hypothetical protein